MLEGLLLLSLLIWLPVLFYGITRQGFVLLLVWLLIAPVAVNLVEKPGTNPFFRTERGEARVVDPTKRIGGYTKSAATVTLKELIEPTRIFFGVFFIVFLGDSVLRRRRLGPFDATEKFALVFSLILIASALFQSRRTAFSLRVACDAFIIPFIAYFCAKRLVTSEDRLRKLTQVLGYVGVYLIIIGFIERLTLRGLVSRVNGPFWSRNELYIVMAVVFFTVLVDSLRRGDSPDGRKALPRVVQQFVLCFVPVIILLGWGRGNLVGFLSGIWMFLFLGRRLLDARPIMTMVGLALLLGPIIGIGLYGLTPEEIVENRVVRTSTIYARIGAWENIIQEISKSPVFGIGLNNLRDTLLETRTRFEGIKSENLAHNSFLSIAGELGLPGLLIYLALAASIIRTGLILYCTGSSSQERWRGVTVISIMIAYLVPAFFDTYLYFSSVSHVYVYVLAGGVAGLYTRRRLVSAFSAPTANRRWIAAVDSPGGI